jgi:putative two-component system response regulator
MTAVIIDDEKINLLLFQVHTKSLGLDTKIFEDPIEALNYIQNNEISIVYVDYMMPKMNGIELIKEFRKTDKLTPVIMITAAGDNFDLKLEALEIGVNEFLSKPINGLEFKLRTKMFIELINAQNLLKQQALGLETEVKNRTQELENLNSNLRDTVKKEVELNRKQDLKIFEQSKLVSIFLLLQIETMLLKKERNNSMLFRVI